MLNLVIILGGMVYAGYMAAQDQKAKVAAASHPGDASPAMLAATGQVQTTALATIDSAAAAPSGAVSSTDFQDAYQANGDHYFKVAGLATGASLLSVFFPPAGIVALSLLTYLSIPVFKNAYTSVFIEHKPRSSIIKTIGIAAGLLAGLSLLAALASLAYFASFRLASRTEQRLRKKLSTSFSETPRTVWMQVDETELEVPFNTVTAGDVLVLQAGELIPLDGKVVGGSGSIKRRGLNGGAQPQEIGLGDAALASTAIVSGKLYVEVSEAGMALQKTTLQGLIGQSSDLKSIAENRAVKASDDLAGPSLIAGAAAGVVLGPVNGIAMTGCNMSDINLLTVPLGTLNFLEIGLNQGVLIKSGNHLERLGKVDAVVFDYPVLSAFNPKFDHHDIGNERARLRPEAEQMIRDLSARKLAILMLSEADEASTRSCADWLGIDQFRVYSDESEKARIVEEMQSQGQSICYVGTELSVEFPLHQASVSITIRNASVTTLELADIVLLDGTLEQVVPLFELSDELRRNQQYDTYASTVPGVASAVGVLFFGLGLPATFSIYILSLGAGMGTAMWPKVSRRIESMMTKTVHA